jgi:hypothetical protein
MLQIYELFVKKLHKSILYIIKINIFVLVKQFNLIVMKKSAIYKFNALAKTFSAENEIGTVLFFKTGRRAVRTMKKLRKKHVILIRK